jgi:hypothetical protein
LPLVVDAVVVEDAAVGFVRVWADGVKASRAEVWGHVARAFKAEARECVQVEALADWAEV